MRGVVPRQAPAEIFDEPAPRQPMKFSLALALIIPGDKFTLEILLSYVI